MAPSVMGRGDDRQHLDDGGWAQNGRTASTVYSVMIGNTTGKAGSGLKVVCANAGAT